MTPADGSSVPSGPSRVQLDFDLPVEQGFCVLTVIGPGGAHWEAGPPAISGSSVSAALRPLGPAGIYQVTYRIISADGHPVSGSTRFTLTQPGSGTPATASVGSAPAPTVQAAGSADLGPWPWIAGAVLILGCGAVAGWRISRA